MQFRYPYLVITVILLCCVGSRLCAQTDTLPSIRRSEPPVSGFYTKLTYCYGIPIRSAAVVSDSALVVAYKRMHLMLRQVPAVQKQLVLRGAEMHIIGKDQLTSDLPEFQAYKGLKFLEDRDALTDIDSRTRGMGGLYASCGEENLLGLIADRYYSNDICVHEFAHTIMQVGLDSVAKNKIHRQYLNAVSKGLWPGAYAIANEYEYWAELSAWYFGAHGEFLKGTRMPQPGSEGLREYDPEGYALLNDIYDGGWAILPRTPQLTPATPVAANRRTEKKMAMLSSFTIFNNTNKTLNANWINFDGKPELYAIIKPQSHYTLQTFTGHVWMLTNAQKVVGYYEVKGVNCGLSIGKALKIRVIQNRASACKL